MDAKHAATIRRRQLDRQLEKAPLREVAVPRRGWISETRHVLGMRLAQIAKRVGVSEATVKRFEQAETDGSITLNSLRKVAAAMDCRLTYAFVPRKTFEDAVQSRARLVASRRVGSVSHTMALEDQGLASEQQQALIDDAAGELVRTLPTQLWSD